MALATAKVMGAGGVDLELVVLVDLGVGDELVQEFVGWVAFGVGVAVAGQVAAE